MGVIGVKGGIVTLIRNHEVVRASCAFAPASASYDSVCAGGQVTLRYDLERGEMLSATHSLSGRLQNCTGGLTTWGSWLTSKEFDYTNVKPRMLNDGDTQHDRQP